MQRRLVTKSSSFSSSLPLLITSSLLFHAVLHPPCSCYHQQNTTSSTVNPVVVVKFEPNSTSSSAHETTIADGVSRESIGCRISTVDPFVHNVVAQLVRDRTSLIEYRLNFTNYVTNPLTTSDVIDAYRADRWARVTTAHGQTLLSLAFNYGIISMSTLTIGTRVLNVELADTPQGCFGASSQHQKIAAVQYLLMRDFDWDGPLKTVDDARVCHEVILDDNGYAQFRHNCCYVSTINEKEECTTEIGNVFIDLLYAMLAIVRFSLLLFSPVLFISAFESMSKNNVPYVVRLKDKLIKTAWICEAQNTPPSWLQADRVLDLRTQTGFPKLQKKAQELADSGNLQKRLTISFDRYDITVDYKRTLKENTVPVGLFQTLFRTLIKCRIRHTGPFKECCKTNIFTKTPVCDLEERKGTGGVTWSSCCRQFSKVLMVLFIPLPFYIRLALFYGFEEAEVYTRKEAIDIRGLLEHYDHSVIHYFTPTHALFICMYLIYTMTAFSLAFLSKLADETYHPKLIIVSSFRDLKNLNWTDVLSMACSNIIWPLKRFGIYGCIVGLFYWPFALIYTAMVSIVYLVPTFYLTLRMMFHAKTAILVKERRSPRNMYQIRKRLDKDMFQLRMETCIDTRENQDDCLPYPQGRADPMAIADDVDCIRIDHFKVPESVTNDQTNTKQEAGEVGTPDTQTTTFNPETEVRSVDKQVKEASNGEDEDDSCSLKSEVVRYKKINWRRLIENVLSAFFAIITLFSCVVILSEVIGCMVEIVSFTIMGVIVNAGSLLKYIMLVLMIFIYCCDCFNNITKKYLKMNKALFSEVNSRIRQDLEEETSRPAHLQENRGFKAQELTQQADYELPDDLAENVPLHWMINDLVMFVDSEDMPRIPRKLFELVCNIRVAGVPGPIYQGHIEAVTQLFKVILFVCFVFVIVLSFSAVYKVSSTNQMLATMLGGFLPMVLRTFLAPPAPDVELGTVSFKSKMDEIIKNFCQFWPIHDLPFDVVPDPSPDEKKDGDTSNEKKVLNTTTSSVNNNVEHRQPDVDMVDSSASRCMPMVIAADIGGCAAPFTVEPMLFSLVTSLASPATNFVPDPKMQSEDVDREVKDKQAIERFLSTDRDASKVDLLIYLPQDQFENKWLPEWSLADFDEPDSKDSGV